MDGTFIQSKQRRIDANQKGTVALMPLYSVCDGRSIEDFPLRVHDFFDLTQEQCVEMPRELGYDSGSQSVKVNSLERVGRFKGISWGEEVLK